ncbi:MAG: hypothetical protein ACK41G_05610 [Candidatus Thermochlorobacter sp.]
MSILRDLIRSILNRYSEEHNEMIKMIEEEKQHGYLKDLIETGDRLIEENPNYVDEVQKSETGCWMEQMYQRRYCRICDFTDDCPIHLEEQWQAFLAQQTPERRAELEAMIAEQQVRYLQRYVK